ncbi:glycosyl hydrolase family 61-domain-containing protein [Cadophora sp. MPI-SDFR-AT-0126]|nr:glycosyl hydrolase family 61-domain-containing protein [Leotiomycetes sp. MPI-SDFR-AT-0126]
MKVSIIVAGIAQVASAHYFFNTNIINGVTTSANKYIRASTRATAYNPIKFSSNPAADIRDGSYIDGPDSRCNQGAFTNAGKTEVMTVAAGSEVRFKLGVGATMAHPGPGLMYMSRAPNDDVKSYDGSGDWFKIFQEGVCNTNADFTTDAWCTWDRDWIAATIPKDTPSGEYLVRVEHIGIHKSFQNQPEHYTSCAQVKVTDGGSGSPGPLVKFPGAYKDTDEYANFSIYNGYKTFPFPGPAVWNGTSSSTASVPAEPVKSSTSSKVIATSTVAAVLVKPSTTFQVVTKTSSKSAASAAPTTDDGCSD